MKKEKLKKLMAITVISSMIATGILPNIKEVQAIAKEESNSLSVSKSNMGKRNVMYYGDWSIWGGQGNFYPKDIPADQLTNLNFAFLDFDSNGNLIFTDKDAAVGAPVGQEGVQWGAPNAGLLIALQQLRAENPNLKLGASVGGWSKSADFSSVAKDPAKRANLVNNLVKFVEYTNMDLIDLDWEYPGDKRDPDKVDNQNDEGNPYAGPEDKRDFVLLLQELRKALDAKGQEIGKKYELSVALPASIAKLNLGVDIKNIFKIVDFANIMTYDMRGAWDNTSGHQTGLYTNPKDPLKNKGLSIDESVNYLISQGADTEKIVIGAAYYTRGWEKVSNGPDSNNPGLFGEAAQVTKDADLTPARGAKNEAPLKSGDGGRMSGVWSYRSLDNLKAQYPGLKEYWDDSAKAPYLYDEKTGAFFTYDNIKSIKEKTSYVNKNDLGGMIAWMAGQDKPTNSSKRDELTKVTKNGLYGQSQLPQNQIVYPKLDVSTTVQSYKESWGNNTGYEITIVNNEKLEEGSSDVLKQVERGAETIKAPKLYIKSDSPLTSGDYLAGNVSYEDGYTIVDLQSVWEGKNIEPGKSYKFRLKGNGSIKSIDLVQRMSAKSPDMYRQTVYGEVANNGNEGNSNNGGETQKENTAPELKGVLDLSIKIGDAFNPLDGVTAIDKEDGDLTSKIIVEGKVDKTKVGSYELKYKVVDSKGVKIEKVRTIKVINKEINDEVKDVNFGVGQGIKWPEQVYSPYADMCAWITKPNYSNSGVINLKKIYEDTGIKFFNLGFIQGTSGVSNGKVNWGWGGFTVLNEENKDNTQYLGIKKSIKDIREVGGDVTVSLGGINGTPFWEVTQDVEILFNTYKELVQGYGLTRLDLDIEGAAQGKAINIANAKAIKKLQQATGVDIVLTLPVLPEGLTQVQLDVLEAYLSQGVDVKLVNIMTMCYGSGTLIKGENYGTASLRAVDSTKEQLKTYFKKYANVTLSDKEAYRKIGTTPSIGFEGSAHPIFTTEWTKLVVNQAIQKGLGMVSFWSLNRDAMVENNKGVSSQYEFTNICKKFGKDGETTPIENTKPVINGASNKTITVGDKFNPLEGVTASDDEDGDLTSKIQVSGKVETTKIGKYEVTYKVVDSKGLETINKIVVEVKEKPAVPTDTYDANKVYLNGDTVIYKGKEYKAKWWVKGENPDSSQAWEKKVASNKDGSISYEPGMIFLGGQKALYNGNVYEAKWWTNTVPGSDDSWRLVS